MFDATVFSVEFSVEFLEESGPDFLSVELITGFA